MEEEEHEVYGGEIPMEAEMEADMEHHGGAADDDAVKVGTTLSFSFSCCVLFIKKNLISIGSEFFWNLKELDEMKKRLKEMEDEAVALREMQAKVEKEMGSVQGLSFYPWFMFDLLLLVDVCLDILTISVKNLWSLNQ